MFHSARLASPPSRNVDGAGHRVAGGGSGSGTGRELVVHQITKETGVTVRYPILTRTNYTE